MEFKVLDLFSGAGGLSLGFQRAGYSIVGAIDEDLDAIKTHKKNFPDSTSINKDIKKITTKCAQEKFGKEIDIIIGGPPCQGFSNANMWQKDSKDDRNKLFFEFIRFVKDFKPKALVIENVKGILSKNNGFAKNKIYEILENLGYDIKSKVLIASDYGVPQKRKRAFFVGIKKNISENFTFDLLEKKDELTVYDAISDLYGIEGNGTINIAPITNYQELMRKNFNKIYNNDITNHTKKVKNRIQYVPQGGNWKNVPHELWNNHRNNRHSSAYKRLDENKPSITIDTGHMNYFHPKFNRVPTARESARIQSFPDDFIFQGSKTSQYRQVGNAVPPLLSEEIAKAIKKLLKEKYNV